MQKAIKYVVLAGAASTISFSANAEHAELPDMTITGTRTDFSSTVIQPDLVNAPQGDIAQLLNKIPGASVNSNGALTGIAQYRGMYGDRVNILVDGVKISSGGPNLMDPSLSYIPRSQLATLNVIRGIAPVRSGNETIGGTMEARSIQGEFGHGDEFEFHGRAVLGAASADKSYDLSTMLSLANQNHRMYISGSREDGGDIRFGDGGDIIPSEHERNNYEIGYGYQRNGHELSFDYMRRDADEAGTPALPMDIEYVDADVASVKYKGDLAGATINSKLYYSQVDHRMSNFTLRDAPIMTMMGGMMMPMRRFALTDSMDYGYGLDVEFDFAGGSLVLGTDGHIAEHNADIFNPMSSSFLIENYNDIERDVFGLYAEWDRSLNEKNDLQIGVRYTRVNMDAGTVSATGFPMMMLQNSANMLAANFNASERDQTDNNVDVVLKLTHHLSDTTDLEFGVARKTRAPSYQERYLWLPLQSTGGLADGNNYVGNVNLDSEVAYQIEFGVDYQSDSAYITPRVFYHHVDDYIQGVDFTGGGPAQMFHNMMTTMLGSNAKLLQFANVDARLYGIDTSWGITLNPRWRLDGVLSLVEGKRRDTDDYLYRIAPITANVGLTHQRDNWSATLETVVASSKSHVSSVNAEPETAGYTLLNVYGQYHKPGSPLRVLVGVDNILDKFYTPHLNGVNRVSNSDVAQGSRVPGPGISAYINLAIEW